MSQWVLVTRTAASGLEEGLKDLLIDRVDGCQVDPRDGRSPVRLDTDDLTVQIARIVAELGIGESEAQVAQRTQSAVEPYVNMPAPEPNHGARCLRLSEDLTLEHATDKRQRHGHMLSVGQPLGKPLGEAAADRPQLVEQERLGHALHFYGERLADLDQVANARVGVGAQEDLPADRAPLDAG